MIGRKTSYDNVTKRFALKLSESQKDQNTGLCDRILKGPDDIFSKISEEIKKEGVNMNCDTRLHQIPELNVRLDKAIYLDIGNEELIAAVVDAYLWAGGLHFTGEQGFIKLGDTLYYVDVISHTDKIGRVKKVVETLARGDHGSE